MSSHDYYLLKILDYIEMYEEWNKENRGDYKEWLEETFIIPLSRVKREINDRKIKKNNNYMYFYPSKNDLKILPTYSFLLKILFTLKKPYTSKGESEFNIIDGRIFENPIVRDNFFGVPMVKPSTWKGQLRFAGKKFEEEKNKGFLINNLFGNEKSSENMRKGKLYFFPTFFIEKEGQDVITPINRETRTPAKGPLIFEVMNAEKSGEFYLLYFPYPRRNNSGSKEFKKDLQFLIESLVLMFYTYGFSAKKSSGFGIIKEQLKIGKIWLKLDSGIIEKEYANLYELKNRINEPFKK